MQQELGRLSYKVRGVRGEGLQQELGRLPYRVRG